jgi:hypothetical protein
MSEDEGFFPPGLSPLLLFYIRPLWPNSADACHKNGHFGCSQSVCPARLTDFDPIFGLAQGLIEGFCAQARNTTIQKQPKSHNHEPGQN